MHPLLRFVVTIKILLIGFIQSGCMQTQYSPAQNVPVNGSGTGNPPQALGFTGFSCVAGRSSRPVQVFQKLTKSELESRLYRLIFSVNEDPVQAAEMWEYLVEDKGILTRITSERNGQYPRSSDSEFYSDGNIQALYSIADTIARSVSENTQDSIDWRTSFVGSCSLVSSPSEECLENFLRSLMTAVSPSSQSTELMNEALVDMSEVVALDASSPKKSWIHSALSVALLSAGGLFRTQFGTATSRSGWKYLSDQELIDRLAGIFWGESPDNQLRSWADQNQIRTNYDRTLNYVFDSPKFTETLRIFGAAYMRLGDTRTVDFASSPAVVNRLQRLGLSNLSLDSTYSTLAKDEALNFFVQTIVSGGPFSDLFLSDASYAQGELAAAQGVASWVEGQPPARYGTRKKQGLFTMSALHLSDGSEKSHIHAAYTLFKNYLCLSTPSPESAGINTQELQIPIATGLQSSRQRTEQLTSSPTCISCHQQFDALGFGFGHIDQWGIPRQTELIYNKVTYAYLGQVPLNTSVRLRVGTNPEILASSPRIFAEEVLKTQYLQACFARQFFRFAFGKEENLTGEEACALEELMNSLSDSEVSIREALRKFAKSKFFTEVYRGE